MKSGFNKRTPLGLAAEKGNEAVVKLLLESSGVDTNMKDNDVMTPLAWTAYNRHKAVHS
jgi:ankyrin repeat protein